ncbi:MAG: translation initiation factor IF-2, partial [Epsilonproteobacteria bacterium]|nr:translation initiation factor IF-2 [Campylobacterota bacterium]
KTKVAEKEKGGITQHVAAYEVVSKDGNMVFLDTPGHEAFSLMRERGVLMADLVVLVIALDDGIKPQTVESIKKIQEFGSTAVVALNKVDKAKADRLDIVKRQLADYGLLPDDWGGDVPTVAISAKTGQGIDELLEVIRLQADILDLKTSTTEPAQGVVLESMVEHGRGSVASIILHRGKICRGDYFTCGATFGKVSSMQDCYGNQLSCVGPSVPVSIAGFAELPQAGDMFEFATQSQAKKHKNLQNKIVTNTNTSRISTNDQGISIIVKTSTLLSKEALLASLKKLSDSQEVKIKIIDSGIGDINESNLDLAATTGALVYGLGVKANKSAIAKLHKPVTVKQFDIIYKLLEDVEEVLKKNIVKKVEEKELGKARVKAIFRVKSVGVIAGAAVEEGVLQKGAKLKVFRNGEQIGGGVIKTLQKERTSVSSISAGSDCAFALDGFSDWKIDDEVHCYIENLV